MSAPALPRRLLLVGAAAAMLPLRDAVAQASAANADWLAMVQAHHAVIARSLQELVQAERRTFMQRDRLIRTVAYQLTAHSVAEENAVYPALALAGLGTEADRLYLDQAHAKIITAQLQLAARANREGNDWLKPAQALQAAVVKHAKDDEEGNLYPQLQQRLSPEDRRQLTQSYAREFTSVREPRAGST